MTLTGWAAGYAEELLSPLRDRWEHVQGVVRQAERIAAILPAEEREVLVAAAYLHDLGYASALTETGFHALDGARHLRALGHERLAGLVAYHSGARGEAELRGLTVELAEFTDEASATSMALTYCDMTTGPAGEVITYEERLAGVKERYGAEHVVARSVRQARTEVERSTAFVEGRLREVAASQISLGLILPTGAIYDSRHHWTNDAGVWHTSVGFDAGGYSCGHIQGPPAALRELAAALLDAADQADAAAGLVVAEGVAS